VVGDVYRLPFPFVVERLLNVAASRFCISMEASTPGWRSKMDAVAATVMSTVL
jgi:hypothetical protein